MRLQKKCWWTSEGMEAKMRACVRSIDRSYIPRTALDFVLCIRYVMKIIADTTTDVRTHTYTPRTTARGGFEE